MSPYNFVEQGHILMFCFQSPSLQYSSFFSLIVVWTPLKFSMGDTMKETSAYHQQFHIHLVKQELLPLLFVEQGVDVLSFHESQQSNL